MSTPSIPGLPPGAQVRSLGGRSVQGLPPGAQVRPLGGAPSAPAPTAAPTAAAPTPSAESLPGDDSFLTGVWNTTLKPMWDQAKGYLQDPKSWVVDSVQGGPAAKIAQSMLMSAYDQGRKSVQHGGAAIKEAGGAASDLLHGDLKGMNRHGEQFQQAQSLALGHGVAAMVPGVGPAAAEAGENIGNGKPRQGAGEATGLIAQTLLGGALNRKLGAAAKPIEAGEAVEKLTDAVNPAAEHMPGFRANLGEHLGRVVDYAKRTGIDLANSGREGFLKALRGAGEEAQNFYDKEILEPVQDRLASNGESYGALEKRLRHLNRTTSYNATTAAESEAQIARKAEANSIRRSLNDGLAKELKITPEQVAEARAAGEKLGDLADKTELARDIEKHAANAQTRSSVTVHAQHGGIVPGTPVGGGRVSAAVTRGVNKVIGHPADNAVNKVFQKLKAPAPAINPDVQPPRPPSARVPDWKANPTEPVSVGQKDFTPDLEGAKQRLSARQSQGDISKLSREMEAAADGLSKKETLARHPLARNPQPSAPAAKTRVNGSSESDGSLEAINANKSAQAKGIQYVVKTRGGTERPVMKTELRPEDVRRNPGETLWKKYPDGRMEKVN